MGTSSAEILAKEFDQVRKGGIDPDQVTSYLRTVADDVARLRAELDKARAEARAAESRASEAEKKTASASSDGSDDEFTKLGSRVAAVLQSAETHAAEMTDEARAHAEGIRHETDEYDRRVRGEAEDYARRTRADADAYAELVTAEAESRARGRVETILSEASESRRRTVETEQGLLERLRNAAEDVRLTLESFEASAVGSGHGDDPADADAVFAEVRDAASVFSTAAGLSGSDSSPSAGYGSGHDADTGGRDHDDRGNGYDAASELGDRREANGLWS